MGLQIIRIKVAAVFLNPDGMGIVSQITTLQNLLSRVVDLGIGSGVTKYIAEYRGKKDYQQLVGVYKTSITGFALTGILVILSCTALSGYLAKLILGNEEYSIYIILAGIAVSLTTQFQVIKRTLQGLLKIQETVILSLVSSFVGVAVSVPMIIFFDVTGAVISFALAAAIALIFGHFYLDKVVYKIDGLKLHFGKIEKKHLQNLLKFGGANSTVFISNTVSILAIRSMIINEYGAEANGLYQVAIGVATSYLSIVSTSIWQYAMPKVATIMGNVNEIQSLQNQAMRLTMLVLSPIIVLLLVTRELWIPILYSPAFMASYTLITWQLVGEFFRSLKWGANIVNQPYERYKFIMLQSLAVGVLSIIFFLLLKSKMGLVAAPISYALTHAVLFPFIYAAHRAYDNFRISRDNWMLMFLSVLLIGVSVILFYYSTGFNLYKYIVMVVALIGWGFLGTNKIERFQVKSFIKRKIRG